MNFLKLVAKLSAGWVRNRKDGGVVGRTETVRKVS